MPRGSTGRYALAVLLTAALTLTGASPVQAAPAGPPPRPAAPAAPDPALTAHPLTAAAAPLDNPLKGFAKFYTPGANQNVGYPHSLTWGYFGLSEIMKTASNCGTYDWSIVDGMLAETAAQGNQAAIRVYLTYPGGTGTHPANAIPACFTGNVTMRSDTYWNVTHPDYNSAYLITALKNFIAAFGARYDGDPRLGFVHLGLVGLWGEWHTWPYDSDTADGRPDYMPTDANGAQLLAAYDNAFSTTKLELRYPGAAGGAANSRDIGFHDDSFCYREGSPLQGVTLPVSMGGASYAQLQRKLDAGVENKWITSSMGGELRPEIQSTAFASWPNGSGAVDNLKACLELDHTTWMINEQSANYSPTDANVAAAVRLMGYNLTVDNAYFKNTASGTTNVGVRISNTGVAPFYYPWQVTLGLKNTAGAVVRTWDTPWDLRTVQPLTIRDFPDWNTGGGYRSFGYPQYFQAPVDLTGVAQGGYQWVLRVKNPMETVSANARKLRFANTTQQSDGWVGLGAVTVGSGNGGTPTSYEAEASGNTRTGGAVVASCGSCSGGNKVGYLGNGATLAFTGVAGGTGGSRTVTIYYTSAVVRTATVNGQTVTFPATADWNTVGSTGTTLTLPAGTSTITIANPSGWAPDIDRITVS
ncbi:MAG: DUF4832 domain-containing protein [Actinoplanes sp.]